MRSLKTLNLFARLVLAWFLASVVVASASPLVHPTRFDMVCTTGGPMKWVAVDSDSHDDDHAELTTLSCPACLPFAAPAANPKVEIAPFEEAPLHLVAVVSEPDVRSSPRAPLPPRGPPRLH